ncbi:MAG: 16S rRNA (adenine(1518)-N(6)/adenine(1519)-N(6))-dimethyltransferase RsmA [Opitutales bacterium]
MLTLTQTRECLDLLGHGPRKQLGQNFLVEPNIVRKSLSMAALRAGDLVVEIGPGLGTLTRALLEAGAKVWAIEFDRDLFRYLSEALAPQYPQQLDLREGDALEFPLAGLSGGGAPWLHDAPFKIVANLPYAVATPWMDAVLESWLPEMMVLMVQKEAADRYTARPGTKHYGPITIFLEAAYFSGGTHKVSSRCFFPAPEVDSALLKLVRHEHSHTFQTKTKRLIRDLFTQRRKQIGGLCRQYRDAAIAERLTEWVDTHLAHLGIESNARPEQIPLEGWLTLDRLIDG